MWIKPAIADRPHDFFPEIAQELLFKKENVYNNKYARQVRLR